MIPTITCPLTPGTESSYPEHVLRTEARARGPLLRHLLLLPVVQERPQQVSLPVQPARSLVPSGCCPPVMATLQGRKILPPSPGPLSGALSVKYMIQVMLVFGGGWLSSWTVPSDVQGLVLFLSWVRGLLSEVFGVGCMGTKCLNPSVVRSTMQCFG